MCVTAAVFVAAAWTTTIAPHIWAFGALPKDYLLALIDAVMQIVQGAPNLLSQARMRDNHTMQLVAETTIYLLHHKEGVWTLVFDLHKDVYPLT